MSGAPDVAIEYSADVSNWTVLKNTALVSGSNDVSVGDVPDGYFRAAFSLSSGSALVGLAEARLLKRDPACGCANKASSTIASVFP